MSESRNQIDQLEAENDDLISELAAARIELDRRGAVIERVQAALTRNRGYHDLDGVHWVTAESVARALSVGRALTAHLASGPPRSLDAAALTPMDPETLS